MRLLTPTILFLAIALLACNPAEPNAEPPAAETNTPKGTLFIIGGGKRPPALVQELASVSGIDSSGYAIILPMSSSEPDTAAYYAIRQFTELGLPADRFRAYDFQAGERPAAAVDSLRNARLIYITGGDQRKFMEVVEGNELENAIREAYEGGATIAGTSAGAAVMSETMITGDEKKHPEYTGDFRTIEADNLIYSSGLGLLPQAIVDQHFIYRMRMNRLIAAVLEHPGQIGVGIDESTAFIVEEGQRARVAGDWQVVVLRNLADSTRAQSGLLGGKGLELSILLPGDTLQLAE